jgi:hypothetical protein
MNFRYSATCTTMVFLLGNLLGTFVNASGVVWNQVLVILAATCTFHISHFILQFKHGSVSKKF